KPIEPKSYDGAPDVHLVSRFISECEVYLEMLNDKKSRDVLNVSRYLEGKARRYYDRVVQREYWRWELTDFFRAMFNYCFPKDFLTDVRSKIDGCYQGSRTVRDYAYELQDYYHIIDDESERSQVLRLHKGFRTKIRSELKLRGYHPETCDWETI
ncbi:hypothetical protein BDZ89DRAFT_884136, partial [Hymenopellis radicata]